MPLFSSTLSLIRDAHRVLGARLALLFALTLASAVLEGLSLAMLLPLLTALGLGQSGASPDQITAAVLKLFASAGVPFSPVSVAVLLLILLTVSAGVFLLQAYFAARLQTAYVAHWQKQLFD